MCPGSAVVFIQNRNQFLLLREAELGPCGSDKSYCVVHDFIIFSFMFVVMSFP